MDWSRAMISCDRANYKALKLHNQTGWSLMSLHRSRLQTSPFASSRCYESNNIICFANRCRFGKRQFDLCNLLCRYLPRFRTTTVQVWNLGCLPLTSNFGSRPVHSTHDSPLRPMAAFILLFVADSESQLIICVLLWFHTTAVVEWHFGDQIFKL